MHGLVNKAIQYFLVDTYGQETWEAIAQRSGVSQLLGEDGFETMQRYDDSLTTAVIAQAVALTRLPAETLLEDLGTFLVSSTELGAVRRLLRFGGLTFTDFLYSLDELQGRSHLAVPDLGLPDLWVLATQEGRFQITCRDCPQGFGHVLLGILRALADDYGTLAVLEHRGRTPGTFDELLEVEVHDPTYAAGRHFELAAGVN